MLVLSVPSLSPFPSLFFPALISHFFIPIASDYDMNGDYNDDYDSTNYCYE
jgi:hypothetical protein